MSRSRRSSAPPHVRVGVDQPVDEVLGGDEGPPVLPHLVDVSQHYDVRPLDHDAVLSRSRAAVRRPRPSRRPAPASDHRPRRRPAQRRLSVPARALSLLPGARRGAAHAFSGRELLVGVDFVEKPLLEGSAGRSRRRSAVRLVGQRVSAAIDAVRMRSVNLSTGMTDSCGLFLSLPCQDRSARGSRSDDGCTWSRGAARSNGYSVQRRGGPMPRTFTDEMWSLTVDERPSDTRNDLELVWLAQHLLRRSEQLPVRSV